MDEIKKILNSITLSETSEQLSYSILPMLYDRISSKELLHSQIIASLLDPNEKHGLGDVPLSLFLKKIGCTGFARCLTETKVYVEKGVDNMRRIDILLTNGDNAIIIENKLNNAVDQLNQLQDYFTSINKHYKTLKIVYMPLYACKSATERVGADIVNIYPQDLIEWLEECNSSVCTNYINLLKYMNQSNRNFMEAKKIMAELSDQQIEKLVAVASIVNSADWYTARFEPVKTGVEGQISNVICKVNNNVLSLWLEGYDFWVDLYARATHYDLYAVDYKIDERENNPYKLIDTDYVYDSEECSKRYFKSPKSYHISFTDNQVLINDIVALLTKSINS